jgi:hypothetical protein
VRFIIILEHLFSEIFIYNTATKALIIKKKVNPIKNTLLFGIFALTVLALLFSAGCGTSAEKKLKCDIDSDCPAPTGSCQTSGCESGFCASSILDDCCGNRRCESGENPCSCPTDCKPACNGSIMVKNTAGKSIPSLYLKKLCNEQKTECLVGIDPNKQRELSQFNTHAAPGFGLDITTRYQQPFDKTLSRFVLDFELKSIDLTKVGTPVIVKQVRVMEGTNIVASKDIRVALSTVGDKGTAELEMSYELSDPELAKSLSVNVEYEYTPLKKVGESYELLPDKIGDYKYSITQKVTLIDISLATD